MRIESPPRAFDTRTVSHSRPIEVAGLPGEATIQEICVQSYYVQLDPNSNLRYDTVALANFLDAIVGHTDISRMQLTACPQDLQDWLTNSLGAAVTEDRLLIRRTPEIKELIATLRSADALD